MPKALDSKLLDVIERAYVDRPSEPSLKALAGEFQVGESTLKKLSAQRNWPALRRAKVESKAAGRVEGAKAALATKKIDGREAIEIAIATLAAEVTAVEAKSMEGVANALGNLLKTQRELYQPTLAEFCRWMIEAGYDIPSLKEELIRQTRWTEQQSPPDVKQA